MPPGAAAHPGGTLTPSPLRGGGMTFVFLLPRHTEEEEGEGHTDDHAKKMI